MPSNCTGFSAFDLLYSRSVRGPLTSGRIESSGRPDQPAVELREKLSECALLTSQEADHYKCDHEEYPHPLIEWVEKSPWIDFWIA
ncbi:hypothetical protein Pcinc_014122 [Petrolisthes cinctipes]|uniref:Uncharacterized protein n=1 Tax=Petrolisthes cinctipes TaxID=88211 RepID=A0AAE1KPK5_PETCI|nr:hypothetical protein Pcinc_014122 [Petrolisthes cinctipes]